MNVDSRSKGRFEIVIFCLPCYYLGVGAFEVRLEPDIVWVWCEDLRTLGG